MRMMQRLGMWIVAGTALVACGGSDSAFTGAASTGTGGSAGSSASASGSAQGGAGAGQGGSAQGGAGAGQGGSAQGGAGAGQGGSAQGGAGAGQGGSAQGSGGQAGAGTGGGGATEQNCVDGMDDDGDGMADCTDPDCTAGFTCVPAAPGGWLGVGWLDSSPIPPACPAGLSTSIELFDAADLNAPAATCGCACQAPTGVDCATHLRCAATATECAASGPANGQSTSCGTNIPNVSFPAQCRADPPGAFGGSCAPAPLGNVPPWMWSSAATACLGDSGGTCSDAGELCIAKLGGAMGPCIARQGDQVCPAPFTAKIPYWDGMTVVDDRACDGAGCACGAPMSSSCDCGLAGCQVVLYSDNACGTQVASVPMTGMCVPVALNLTPATARIVGATVVPGSCPVAGTAQPTGGVMPTAPVTVCCVP